MEVERLRPLKQSRRSGERRARYSSQPCRVIFIAEHGIQSKITFMRVQRVNFVAKPYDQPKETRGGGGVKPGGVMWVTNV